MYTDSAGTKVSPTQQTSRIGEKATFVCKSDSDVTWTHNGDKLPPNVKESKTPEGYQKITITNVKLFNKGTYECESSELNKVSFRDEGTLIVKEGMHKYGIHSCFSVFVYWDL